MTAVSAVFNRRSRFSWSLPAILNTWRSSSNQTAPHDRPNHGKNNIEESIGNDYSYPLPLVDKDATLKDSEIAGNKGINGILQCINEGPPTIHETEENDELGESKEPVMDDVKPEMKDKPNSQPVPKTDDDKVTFTVKQKHVDVKPGSKSEEDVTASYSIPVDHKWKNDTEKKNSLSAHNKPTVNQKHLSPIYIEMNDVVYKDENDSTNDLYSVPIDSVNDSKVISENIKHISSPTRGKKVVEETTSLPIITNTMQSNCKPQGTIGNRNSFHNDDIYSVPVDDINSNTPGGENVGQRMYTPPVKSPRVRNFNPSYKEVQANDSSVTEYSDPVTTMHASKDDPFAVAVANIQSTKKHKHKPVKPTPYKSKTSTAPRQEDPPLYEEVLQTAATLPSSNGLHHNLLPTLSLNKTKKSANAQEPLGLDDYTVPSTDKLRLQKNPSYGDVCDTTEPSDYYTYVPTNRLIRPNVLDDACTTYTEC